MRQTNLNFEELLQELDNPTSVYPRCLLINEIGEFLENGGEEAKKAESFLRELLNGNNPSDKFYSFCFLSTVKVVDIDTLRVLRAFKENPQNIEIIAEARVAIKGARSAKAPNN